MKKKVLLVVVDALASRVLLPAMDAGELKNWKSLADRGVLRPVCTSIFPSITPAATASIVTGVYPTNHHVAGAFWYDRKENNVAYYGDDFWVMIEEGINKFLNDFLVRLNHDRLHAETLYQRIERHGLTAACLNYMWFRGETEHQVRAPLLLRIFPRMTFAPKVLGPKVLGLADFISSSIPGHKEKLTAEGGVARRYGFHDDTTADYLVDLAKADPFPDFTLAYFPNNDFVSHRKSPHGALQVLEQVGDSLHRFIEARGGLDRFLDEFTIVITGDHSQSDVLPDEQGRRIRVAELLPEYKLAEPGYPWKPEDDLFVCPNMRACHIYLKSRAIEDRDRVIQQLLVDPRVDQVCYRASVWERGDPAGHVEPRTDTFFVATADHGVLEFRLCGEHAPADGHDVYGNRWAWKGNLGSVAATVDDDRCLTYSKYPNALERIATGFCQLAGDLWVTAKQGCEFALKATSVHDGGSHGALNLDDSAAPLLVAGLPEHLRVPEFPRTIDVAPLCLQVLGLDDECEDLLRTRSAGRPH